MPETLVIPLHQHTGVPCTPLVKPKQEVVRGEKIGDVDALITAPVHASASGVVERVAPQPQATGAHAPAVLLKPDPDQSLQDGEPVRTLEEALDLPRQEIVAAVRAAGIVGMGGAGFPTHVKLSPPPGKTVEIAILNGAECEPYLTADHRIMLERTGNIIEGFRLIMQALDASEGIIGIEDNKPDAIAAMRGAVQSEGLSDVRVIPLHTRYPQGAEKTLIRSVTGREVPSGGLPADVGVLVSNVGTAVAVRDALIYRKPLIERVVTISGGAISQPANLLVLVGTPIRLLLEACGWFPDRTARVILGGPMMGVAVPDIEIPVTKATSGILALTEDQVTVPREYPCIGCGRCLQACPMDLTASRLALLCRNNRAEEAKQNGLLDCFECGSCAYGCPAKIPLVHWMRVGKATLRRSRAA